LWKVRSWRSIGIAKGRSCAEGKAAKRIKSSLCRSRRPRRPAGDADTPFTGACRAASPLAAAEGSRPLPANLPQKGLQRQSYGPGMPGPYRTAKNTPAPSQNGAGVLPILVKSDQLIQLPAERCQRQLQRAFARLAHKPLRFLGLAAEALPIRVQNRR